MGPIIEITGETRTTRLVSFANRKDAVLSIGRAFSNDIILDDPYVDPQHGQLQITADGHWSYRDLGSENGSKLDKQDVSHSAVQSSATLTLGKTQLQLFDAGHVVAPALSIRNPRQRLLNFNTLPISIGLVLASAVLLASNLYFNYTGEEIRLSDLVGMVMLAYAPLLVIGTAWSLLSKILRGRSHFRSVINVSLIAFIVLELFEYPFVALAYNLPAIDRSHIGAIINVAIFAAYLYATLLICTRLTMRTSQVVAALIPVTVFGFYLVTLWSNASEHSNYPDYNGRILAPMVLLQGGESTDDLMQRLPAVFDEADELID